MANENEVKNQAAGGGMDWDATLTQDPNEAPRLLDEGTYTFYVQDMVRSFFPGSDKLSECNKADLTLRVDSGNGPVIVKCSLLLHDALQWKLSQFFTAIGQKKHGQDLKMDWSKVPGSMGKVYIKHRTYTKNGEERTVNNVDHFVGDGDLSEETKTAGQFEEISSDEELPF